MSKRSIGYTLFAVFMVIMVTGQGRRGKLPGGRGVGCSGGVRFGGGWRQRASNAEGAEARP
jgi:hypothetical protein